MDEEIIKLTKYHIKQSGEVLSRAFYDDPVSIQLLPNEDKRKLKLRYIFQMITCLGVKNG